jgi:hypothetical protein
MVIWLIVGNNNKAKANTTPIFANLEMPAWAEFFWLSTNDKETNRGECANYCHYYTPGTSQGVVN